MFLIDASTREGMSGSPVYSVKNNFASFGSEFMAGPAAIPNFLGVYAGRIGDDIEIGRVFKTYCVDEVIKNYYKNNPKKNTSLKITYIIK